MTKKTRKTHKMRKVLLTVCCAALLVCVTIGATVAYLTSTATVNNTFTVGKVEITLDEVPVNTAGEVVNADNQTEEEFIKDNPDEVFVPASRRASNVYHLLPGHPYTKDPTVHVADDSEDCWLFVKVENGISAIEDSTVSANTIAGQMQANGWSPVSAGSNIYAYKETVPAGEDVPVFGSFKIAGDAVVANYTNATITVTAYAIQADGFVTSAAAIAAAPFPTA